MSIKEIGLQILKENFKISKEALACKNNALLKGWKEVLKCWDDELKNKIEKHLPILINGGVNDASSGVIQDPAGSAVGSDFLAGGGASGAIYRSFDLNPIPQIKIGSSIFNSTEDKDGMRVLHTHSPTLHGDPNNVNDLMNVIRTLANTYLNAMVAFLIRRKELGKHGLLLNLVPVSASIYGGSFKVDHLGYDGHLDPSITIVSIALAIGVLLKENHPIPKMNLYYYEKSVYDRANEYLIINKN